MSSLLVFSRVECSDWKYSYNVLFI
jgi:hypothetical protein